MEIEQIDPTKPIEKEFMAKQIGHFTAGNTIYMMIWSLLRIDTLILVNKKDKKKHLTNLHFSRKMLQCVVV